MKKKTSPAASQQEPEVAAPHPEAAELDGGPVMPDSHGHFEHSATNVSQVDSQEAHQAEQEFARFDQGPVDMPAATPQSSEPNLVAPQAQRKFNVNEHLAQNVEEEPLEEEDEQQVSGAQPEGVADDTQSEATMEEPPEPMPAQDRWAAIRENAARRAARGSEEQSNQSRPSQSVRTEDGETSGEESKFQLSTPMGEDVQG